MEIDEKEYIVQRGCSLHLKHAKWIDAQGKEFNFSLFVRDKIDEEIAKRGV